MPPPDPQDTDHAVPNSNAGFISKDASPYELSDDELHLLLKDVHMNELCLHPSETWVIDLHKDLAEKFAKHAAAIETYWRSFDQKQRKHCMTKRMADGSVLKDPLDQGMGPLNNLIPEWNLRDVTDPESEYLLDHLRYRATHSLYQQYRLGPRDKLGDLGFAMRCVQKKLLGSSRIVKNSIMFFQAHPYIRSFQLVPGSIERVNTTIPTNWRYTVVPHAVGALVIDRQCYLLQCLNLTIEDILNLGSQSRIREMPAKIPDERAVAALSKLSIETPSKVLLLADLLASALDRQASLEEHLNLLSTEPVVLAQTVSFYYFNPPEMVPDEKGQILPVYTDRYISGALFEAIHDALKAAAIWSYLGRLLELLESLSASDRSYKFAILQELSNVCNLEYSRAQASFKCNVQLASGIKWFKRISDVYDKAGNARVLMKRDPGHLLRTDPQLHYILRLCQSETSASKAVDWMKKLGDLHNAHPSEKEKLWETEADSLYDLAIITSFIQDFSPAIALPTFSRKKGQMFIARLQDLDVEMNQLKSRIDLRAFVVPIDNLREPGVAREALSALDQFVIQQAGTKMGFLYQDLIDECLADLESRNKETQARFKEKSEAEWAPLPVAEQFQEDRVEQRQQKEKTRPSHSSVYEIVSSHDDKETEDEAQPLPQTLKVRASTAEVFSTLFSKEHSTGSGSVHWTAFESAMSDLGFSVMPKFGSIYTFLPPENMGLRKSLTVHRPHISRIEGNKLFMYARRLKRVYGWSDKSFEVAA